MMRSDKKENTKKKKENWNNPNWLNNPSPPSWQLIYKESKIKQIWTTHHHLNNLPNHTPCKYLSKIFTNSRELRLRENLESIEIIYHKSSYNKNKINKKVKGSNEQNLHHSLDPESAIDGVDTNNSLSGVLYNSIEKPYVISCHYQQP